MRTTRMLFVDRFIAFDDISKISSMTERVKTVLSDQFKPASVCNQMSKPRRKKADATRSKRQYGAT